MKLSDRVVEIVEQNNFVIREVTEQNGEYYVELNQGTPEGEDWWETVWFDGTEEDFVKAIRKRTSNFDIDEEVEPWIGKRGEDGVPGSIKELLEDAEWKQKKLGGLVEDLLKNSYGG